MAGMKRWGLRLRQEKANGLSQNITNSIGLTIKRVYLNYKSTSSQPLPLKMRKPVDASTALVWRTKSR